MTILVTGYANETIEAYDEPPLNTQPHPHHPQTTLFDFFSQFPFRQDACKTKVGRNQLVWSFISQAADPCLRRNVKTLGKSQGLFILVEGECYLLAIHLSISSVFSFTDRSFCLFSFLFSRYIFLSLKSHFSI